MIDLSILNKGQLEVVNAAYDWYFHSDDPLFQYEGPPGTGKSLVMYYISQLLDRDGKISCAAAYTGAAAIVLRSKGFYNARTLHSILYNPVPTMVYDTNGNPLMDDYFSNTPIYDIGFVPKSTEGIKLLFIDESGMPPRYIRDEIESRGIRVVATGDLRQLPPVEGDSAYLVDGKIHHLTEIMRQEKDNAIIWLSDRAYNGLPIHKGYYGNVLVIEENELTDKMIAASDVILCGKNETRDRLNTHVRHNILKTDSILPLHGERLVCRKNNWGKEICGISLANGLVGTVTNYPDVVGFDGKIFHVDFQPNIMNIPFRDLLVDYDYFTSPYQNRKFIKNSKYNTGEKMEFAYALTTHLAQGNEWSSGIYIQEYLNKDINNRLNYVGLTRFRDRCIYVLPTRKNYFMGNSRIKG